MSNLLYLAGILLIGVGIAHSYLGERYILTRLFKQDNLPKLFGSTDFTRRTLRFAWHLTTVAWIGFALILFHLAGSEVSFATLCIIIGATFVLHGAAALLGSKGKHLSWPFFLAIGFISIYVAGAGS